MGNAGDMPNEQEWETFSKWAKTYGSFRVDNDDAEVDSSCTLAGDLVYINVFGQAMVFVNSAEVAYDMFEKASSIYSDRSESPMLNDLYVPQLSLTSTRKSLSEAECAHATSPSFSGWALTGISLLCGMGTGGGGIASSSIRNFTLLLPPNTILFRSDKHSEPALALHPCVCHESTVLDQGSCFKGYMRPLMTSLNIYATPLALLLWR